MRCACANPTGSRSRIRSLWWNTGALALASIAMQRARRIGPYRTMWLVAGGVLAAVFVIGQLVAWQMLSAAGETVTVNPSNSFLYLLTGLHGLHVLGGLAAWGVTIAQLRRADPFQANGPSRYARATGISCSRSGSCCWRQCSG